MHYIKLYVTAVNPFQSGMPDCIFQKLEGQHAGRSSAGSCEASSQKAVFYPRNVPLPAVWFAGWSARRHREALLPPAASLRMLQLRVLGLLGAGVRAQRSQERCCLGSHSPFSPAFMAMEESPAQPAGRENPGKRSPCFLFPLFPLSPPFWLPCCILGSGDASSTFVALGAVWVYIHLANTLGFVERKQQRESGGL